MAIINLLELLPSHPATLPLFKDINLLPGKDDPLAQIQAKQKEDQLKEQQQQQSPGVAPAAPKVDAASQQELVDAQTLPAGGAGVTDAEKIKELQEEAAELALEGSTGSSSSSSGAAAPATSSSSSPSTTSSGGRSSSTGPSSSPAEQVPVPSSSSSTGTGGEKTKASEQQRGQVTKDDSLKLRHNEVEEPGHVIRRHQGWPLVLGLGGLAGLLVYYIK